MQSICVPRTITFRILTSTILFAILCRCGNSQSSTTPNRNQSPLVTAQSDPAAIQAFQNVMAQSGGEATWKALRSAKETFSVLHAGEKQPHRMTLLDDWSADATRYRRRAEGQKDSPVDHNGNGTFVVKTSSGSIAAPEFDQARALIGRLPAAGAEVMVRRKEYILKLSETQFCKSDQICIDVYRSSNSTLSRSPEQQWKISRATGLPITIRYQTQTFGHNSSPIWKEIYFLKYASENGLMVPVDIATNLAGKRERWTFQSLSPDTGFDPEKFDREATQ